MARGDGKGNRHETDVVFNPQYARHDLTNIDNYEADYEFPWVDKIEKIYEIPKIDDMPGVFLRGIFKNERSLNAHLRLMYRHKKFKDDNHQELLRCKIAGSAAIGGVRALEALFTATNMIASDMYRVARNMPKLRNKEEEKIIRGSDFRQYERQPSEGGLTH